MVVNRRWRSGQLSLRLYSTWSHLVLPLDHTQFNRSHPPSTYISSNTRETVINAYVLIQDSIPAVVIVCEGGAKGYTRHPRGPRDTDETRPEETSRGSGRGRAHKSRRRLLDGRPRTDWVEARSFGYSSLSWLTRAATPTHLHEVALRSGVLACRNCATRPASALCSRRCRLFSRVYSLRCVYRSTLCFRDTASPQWIARYAATTLFSPSVTRVSPLRILVTCFVEEDFSFFWLLIDSRLLHSSCVIINR